MTFGNPAIKVPPETETETEAEREKRMWLKFGRTTKQLQQGLVVTEWPSYVP